MSDDAPADQPGPPGSGQPEPSGTPAPPLKLSPSELEAAIADRQRHLAATLEELSRRLEPARLARTTAADVRATAISTVVDRTGALRVERIGAIAAALAVIVAVSIIASVRTRRRRS